jgi:predicted acylesterase/phospholipase RssA
VRASQPEEIFSFSAGELLKGVRHLPGLVAGAWAGGLFGLDVPRLMLALAERLPAGLCDSRGVANFLRTALQALGGSERFEDLERELHLIATDLLSGERAVFTAGHRSGATIPAATAASTALPFFFKPVEIAGRSYADGGLRGNASLDVALERGARLVICINPMVPFNGAEGGQDESMRAALQAWQVLRINTHAGLHYHLKHLRQRYRGVDFVLIEPRPDDAELLSANLMQFPPQRDLVRHSARTVTADIAARRALLEPVLARHGFALRPTAIASSAPHCDLTGWLGHTLSELQTTLEQLPEGSAHLPLQD